MEGAASNPDEHMEQDLMAMLLDDYADYKPCRRGEIVEGVIATVSGKNILVDIGAKSDAIVVPREVERMTPHELQTLHPGQVVKVFVVEPDEQDSIVVSLARAVQERDWDEAESLLKSGEFVMLQVIDCNRGGVIVRLGRLRGFVPSSQMLSSWRFQQEHPEDPEARWRALIGKTLKLRVIEVASERNRLIFTERPAEALASKRSILKQLAPDSVQQGVVSNIVDFGAFINIKGVDGLLHISELSWQRVAHPSEVLQVGQPLQVYVLDVDLEQERLSLSLKRLTPDPWEAVAGLCQTGEIVEVEIVNLVPFGAFACLVEHPEIEGLIHVSEMGAHKVHDPSEAVQVGERYSARILAIQSSERRVAFSLKRVESEAVPELPECLEFPEDEAVVAAI